jgi:hypothetical protein
MQAWTNTLSAASWKGDMSSKRSPVVYFSHTGHTKALATQIATRLGADLEEVRVWSPPMRMSIGPLLRLVKNAVLGRAWLIELYHHDPAIYDLVVLGGPIWLGRIAPPVKAWVREHRLAQSASFGCFATSSRATRKPWALDDLSRFVGKSAIAICHITDADRASGNADQKIDVFCQALVSDVTVRSAA